MKRSAVVLFSCLALAASAWLGRAVWGQTVDTKEKTYTITKSQLDKYVADSVAKAVAEERDRAAHEKPATDEQVLNPQNWHKAIFNKAEYVIYTGPGQFMFHHWVEPSKPAVAPPKSGTTTPPAGKGG
jgi:hypothetical protein